MNRGRFRAGIRVKHSEFEPGQLGLVQRTDMTGCYVAWPHLDGLRWSPFSNLTPERELA